MLVRFCCYSDREFETYMAVADELGIPYATNRQTVMRKEQQSE
jgi:hypothetical protein